MNSNKLLVSALAVIIVFAASCSTNKKITALKPLPDYSAEVVYEKQLSFINMPIEITIAEVQKQTNKYLTGILYKDRSLVDDNIMMKVTKEAPIVVREQNGKIFLDLPLRINGKVRYGFDKFGVSMYDTRDFYLNGTVRLASLVNLKDWKITTKTTFLDLKWKESPSVNVAGKNVPVTYLINPAINLFKSEIAKEVDEAIEKSLDIKPYVTDALQTLSTPMLVNAEYNTWFSAQPVEVYATKAVVANKRILVGMGLKTYFETVIGKKPATTFNKDALALKAVDKIPDNFKVNVAAYAAYDYASTVVQKNFAGQKFESGKRSVTVNKVELWGKEDKMIVALNMSGSVNGDFYLSGIPKYDAQKKEIYLDQVDFVLDSKNKILKAGSWLAHGMIVNKLAENCRFPIAEQLAEGEKSLKSYLNNYEPVKGIKVNGSLSSLTPDKIILTPNAIVAMVLANGKVAIKIEGMQ